MIDIKCKYSNTETLIAHQLLIINLFLPGNLKYYIRYNIIHYDFFWKTRLLFSARRIKFKFTNFSQCCVSEQQTYQQNTWIWNKSQKSTLKKLAGNEWGDTFRLYYELRVIRNSVEYRLKFNVISFYFAPNVQTWGVELL